MNCEKSMDDRLTRIRENEKIAHTEIYSIEQLFNTDSWLNKPIKTIQEVSKIFVAYESIRVLDLGSGIGRNSIDGTLFLMTNNLSRKYWRF